MAEPSGVVILSRRHPLLYLYANALAGRFPVRQVIFEHRGLNRLARIFRRRAQRLGLPTVLDHLLYVAWDQLVVQPRSAHRIRALLSDYNLTEPGASLPHMDVASHNSPETARALEAARPAVVVLAGASILQPTILDKAPIFLNVHSGLTPRYRGAHGAFWAAWEGRPELAGVTVHVVDQGIDTGGIVAQTTINVAPDDNPRTLVAKQIVASVPLLLAAVERALAGELATYRRDDLDSRLWYPPTLTAYWQFRRQLARLDRAGKLTVAP